MSERPLVRLEDEHHGQQRCVCRRILRYHRASHSYVCPAMGDYPDLFSLIGLMEPKETAKYRRNATVARFVDEGHVTCLPAELFSDEEPDPAAVNYRTGKMQRPQPPGRDADGRRTIVDKRGVPIPRGSIEYQKFIVYQCDECGFRSPSAARTSDHLHRERHSGATNGFGQEVAP